jgi:hypothetical protein
MGRRPTKGNEDAFIEVGGPLVRSHSLAGLRPEADEGVGRGPGGPPHLGIFRRVPYGPGRATKENQDAGYSPNGINGLERIFNGAVTFGRQLTGESPVPQ